MTKYYQTTFESPRVNRRVVKANFACGNITSDGGGLSLRQADRLLDLSEAIARPFGPPPSGELRLLCGGLGSAAYDMVTIDTMSNTLRAELSDVELAARKEVRKMPEYKATRGTLYKYIKMCLALVTVVSLMNSR